MIARIVTILGALLLTSWAAAVPAEKINIYTYHNHPPFITGDRAGMTYDLAHKLNQAGAGRYRFEVVVLPRGRLNAYIQDWIKGRCPDESCSNGWLVPWVNPKWGFIKGQQDPYLWSKLFTDINVVITRSADNFTYRRAASLDGRLFGGMRGHRYVDIDTRVDAGLIRRIDGNHERDNLIKLLKGRIDATLLPESAIRYLIGQDPQLRGKADAFRTAPVEQGPYERFLMFPGDRRDLKQLVEQMDINYPGVVR